MTTFIKISGNYTEVIQTLGLPDAFYSTMSKSAYLEAIEKDLYRIPYVNVRGRVDELKEKLKATEHLASFSYTQGDFFGSVLSVNYTLPIYVGSSLEAEAEGTFPTLTERLEFAYLDDNDNPCAFCITVLRDDSDRTIPEVERKRHFAISVIQNSNSEPNDRQVTYISDSHLFQPEHLSQGEELAQEHLLAEIIPALNSEKIGALIEQCFEGNNLSLPAVRALNARIRTNENIDNCDLKQSLLDELISTAKKYLSNNEQLNSYVVSVKEHAEEDVNFYETEKFGAIVDHLVNKILELLSQQSNREKALYDIALKKDIVKSELKKDLLRDANGQVVSESKAEFKALSLKIEGLRAAQAYEENLTAFQKNLHLLAGNEDKKILKLYQQGKHLLQHIKAIAGDHPRALGNKELSELNQVLICSRHVLTEPILTEPKNEQNIEELLRLSVTVSGKASSRWQMLGAGLLVFAGLALVAAGVLGAIPSGGSSLLLILAGAAGISAGVTGLTGFGLFRYNSIKGLAKSVSDFKDAAKVRLVETAETSEDVSSEEASPRASTPTVM